MSVKVREIIASAYMLLNNASEQELDYMVAIEKYSVVASKMQQEKILGSNTPDIVKTTLDFTDTGIADETFTDFTEDVVYLKFNEAIIPQVPITLLDTYRESGAQAVAFYKESGVGKVELAQKQSGTLYVWYEPRPLINRADDDNSEIEDAFKYLMSTRLAYALIYYVHFKDPQKEADKGLLLRGLQEESSEAKDIYKEKVNRIDNGNKPFSRIPFMAR